MQNNSKQNTLQLELQSAKVGSDEFYRLIHQFEQIIAQGNIELALFLSWYYAQCGSLKDFSLKSFQLSEQIAKTTGHPIAIERMADLLMWGIGIEKNEAKSFSLYQQLANQGMFSLTILSYMYSQGIGIKADEIEASNLLLKAAAQGDTLAFMLLAHRYKIGLGVPVNGVLARAYAELAVKRKFPGSKQKLTELTMRFVSIDSNLVDKMVVALIHNIEGLDDKVQTLMQKTPPNTPLFATNYRQLLSTSLDELGIKDLSSNPEIRGYKIIVNDEIQTKIETLCDTPIIKSITNFASYEECQHLIAQSQPMLTSTHEQLKRVNEKSEVDAFSGDSAVLASSQTSPVNRVIQQRFAAASNIPLSHFEPLSVLKYSKGHEYSSHTDAFDTLRIQKHEEIGDFGGQRITTNLIYLLPANIGGHTYYEAIDHKVKGLTGMAVIHYNAKKDFTPDNRCYHIGTEIKGGEKWLLRTASRRHPLFGNNKI